MTNSRRKRSKLQDRNNLRTGWKAAPADSTVQARRNQRFRLRVKQYKPSDEADALVQQFLANGGKITYCKPGYALGAHRDGVEI